MSALERYWTFDLVYSRSGVYKMPQKLIFWPPGYQYLPYLKHYKSEDSLTFDNGTGCLKKFPILWNPGHLPVPKRSFIHFRQI